MPSAWELAERLALARNVAPPEDSGVGASRLSRHRCPRRSRNRPPPDTLQIRETQLAAATDPPVRSSAQHTVDDQYNTKYTTTAHATHVTH